MNTGNIAGPALAAASIGWLGGTSTLLLAGLGYLCGALILLTMPRNRADGSSDGREPAGLFASMADGARYAWSDRPVLVLLLVVGTVNLGFLGTFSVAIPAHVIDSLGGRPAVLAAIEAAFAAGSILGAALSALSKRPGWPVVPTSIAVVALALGALAMTTEPVVAAVVMLCGGIGSGIANVVLVTAIQRRTPHAYIGRVMGTVTLLTMGLAPVSLSAAGVLLGIGEPEWVILGGAALILLTVPFACRPARAVA